jgi:AcrR family transcriptional regulator
MEFIEVHREQEMSEQVEGRDTRSRIQAVALELFTEQGYDKTSLREIAERLGVTKAALYYHFKSKEEIVESFTGDQVARVEKMLAWAAEQPRTLEARKEFLRRYADSMLETQHHKIMRFYERNQATMKDRQSARNFKDRMAAMIDFLVDEGAPPAQRLRASMAVFTLHACWFVLEAESISDEERMQTALTMAYELIEG